jgi:transcriptional regulator with XRE-family HTH domain
MIGSGSTAVAKKDFEPNERFWKCRTHLGLSRSALADAANRRPVMKLCKHAELDQNYIGRIEQGRIGGGMCRERLAALCDVLGAEDPSQIGLIAERRLPTRTRPANPRAVESDINMNRRQVVAGLMTPALATLVGMVAGPREQEEPVRTARPVTREELEATLAGVRTAYQHSRYLTATAALPRVLAGLHRLPADKSAALAAEAYRVASGLLLKGGESVLAAIAAERCAAAAERTEDELTIASSTRAVAHCLIAVGHAREGTRLAIKGADRLSTRVDMTRPDVLSVYGALLLRGAVAAAREKDRDQAYQLLDAAADAGSRLDVDGNLRWTSFGPTNVTAHRIAVSVELGDAGSAVAHAAKIDLSALELPERRAVVLLDVARALAQWGKWERAFDAVRRAEREAPEEVHGRPAVHRLIKDFAERSPATSWRRAGVTR